MKKLFTLFAFLACFLGAKAEWVEDYSIDYSTHSGFPFYVMGYVPEWFGGVMTDFGAMYKYVQVTDDATETSNVIVTTEGGVDYYKSRITSTACLDINGNKVEFNSSIVPGDVEVISYDVISWECFGENLSQELAKKIADFNMEINGSVTINVEESQESEGVYTLSVILKEHNPLSVVTNQQGLPEVVISKSNSDDITGEQTLMSAKQIKDTINDVIQDTTLNWIEQI